MSVIIPTYNRAHTLGAAIESVLTQSYAEVEVLVVDDGSTDDTERVAASYGSRVRYLHQRNGGVSSARNFGFAHARGEFIALLDSDDTFVPWKLEVQVRVLRMLPDAGMVWTDMTAVDPAGLVLEPTYLRSFYGIGALSRVERELDRAGSARQVWPAAPMAVADAPVYTGDLFSAMLLGNVVHTSTVLLRRDRLRAVGGFDATLTQSGEDYEFHLRTCSHGPVAFIDASSLRYRVGAADQLTAPRFNIYLARNNLTTILRWLDLGRDRIRLPAALIRQRLAQAFRWVGEAELDRGNQREARRYLSRSLHYLPLQRGTTLLLGFATLPPGAFRAARRIRRATRHVASRWLVIMCAVCVPGALTIAPPMSAWGRLPPNRQMDRANLAVLVGKATPTHPRRAAVRRGASRTRGPRSRPSFGERFLLDATRNRCRASIQPSHQSGRGVPRNDMFIFGDACDGCVRIYVLYS